MALTKKQRQILDYVESFVSSNGYSPSYEEIAQAFDYSSLATVHEHLTNLEQKGFLRKNYNKSRSLEVVRTDPSSLALELPLLGTVAAGLPLEVFDSQEDTVAVPHDMIRRGNNYVLRVRGESMIDAGILEGDFVVVRPQDVAVDGEIVVALVGEESEATVKRFFHEVDHVRLQPENTTMEPIRSKDVRVLGKVVGLYRSVP